MLFTDIEGSTVLLSQLGNRYGEALSAQRTVLRAAISEWHGHERGTECASAAISILGAPAWGH